MPPPSRTRMLPYQCTHCLSLHTRQGNYPQFQRHTRSLGRHMSVVPGRIQTPPPCRPAHPSDRCIRTSDLHSPCSGRCTQCKHLRSPDRSYPFCRSQGDTTQRGCCLRPCMSPIRHFPPPRMLRSVQRAASEEAAASGKALWLEGLAPRARWLESV